MNNRILLILCILLSVNSAHAQMQDYTFKRSVEMDTQTWHYLSLPADIYQVVKPDLSDIRIIGMLGNGDTVEAPYLLQTLPIPPTTTPVHCNIINKGTDGEGAYIGFELIRDTLVNQLIPVFDLKNFDWKVKLSGSQDQLHWMTILDQYRILSIKNEHTDYQFTALNFPVSKFRYLRLFIPEKIVPDLQQATLSLTETGPVQYHIYPCESVKSIVNKKEHFTQYDLELKSFSPVCHLKFKVNQQLDYYRPLQVQYVTDSFKNVHGWEYQYATLFSGTISSLTSNEVSFAPAMVKHLKVVIENGDNLPLTIDSIAVEGNEHRLLFRQQQSGKYYLIYGNKNALAPAYDIQQIRLRLPNSISYVQLGTPVSIYKSPIVEKQVTVVKQYWLWGVILVVIVILGWFSFKMITNNKES